MFVEWHSARKQPSMLVEWRSAQNQSSMVSRLALSARCLRTPSRAANRTTDRNHIARDSPAYTAHKPLAPSKHPFGMTQPTLPIHPPWNPSNR
jgi:hypothetical protein